MSAVAEVPTAGANVNRSARCVKCGLTRADLAAGVWNVYPASQACYGGEWDTSDNPGAGFRYPPPAGEHEFEEVAS